MDKTVDIASILQYYVARMTPTTKRRIFQDYRDLVRARQSIGTVCELAEKYGVTRQRIHQIVKEVEQRRGDAITDENQKEI